MYKTSIYYSGWKYANDPLIVERIMDDAKNYSVLLLEDEKATREYLAAMVAVHPHLTLVAEVGSCAEARAVLKRLQPDVLVADIGLPDGSGIDIIREALALYPKMEAMVITVFGDEENVVAALEAGATGYLLKEQALDEMGDAILALMRGESMISPKVARFLLKRFSVASPPEEKNAPVVVAEMEHDLTKRETEVLSLIAKGFSYSDIADTLGLSTNTIRAHIRNIYRKLAVCSRSEAVFEAANLGLIKFDS